MSNNQNATSDSRSVSKKAGTVGMGAIGAALGGIVGGPLGAIVGAAIGAATAQGDKAKAKTEAQVEEQYWRDNFLDRDYVQSHHSYEVYAPAYCAGYEGFEQHAETNRTFEEIEPHLQQAYEQSAPNAQLSWQQARPAARDAYMRLYEERLITGKHRVKTGEVAIAKHIEIQTAKVEVPIEKERVVIERTAPSSQSIEMPGSDAFREGQVTRLEVFEETPDIHKEAFVREEVRIKKETEQTVVTAEEQLRHEALDVTVEGHPVIEANPK